MRKLINNHVLIIGGGVAGVQAALDAAEMGYHVDLIEDKEMHWNMANIFKSCYRLGQQNHSNAERDINKIIWFAERHKQLLKKKIL